MIETASQDYSTNQVNPTSTRPATFAELLTAVRSLAKEVSAVHAPSVDKEARFPHESLQALKGVGALSAAVPRQLGGLGCSMRERSQLCAAAIPSRLPPPSYPPPGASNSLAAFRKRWR